jgi:hypothetical protein
MQITEEHLRIFVEDVLGVRPERIAALVERIERTHPGVDPARAIARSFVPRAALTGVPSGLTPSLPKTIALAFVEQRSALRQRASLLAALAYLDDATFFNQDDWPRRALGLDKTDDGAMLALREAARFTVRLVALRGARRLSAFVPFSGWAVGAAAGAINAIEMGAFATRVLEERAERIAAKSTRAVRAGVPATAR